MNASIKIVNMHDAKTHLSRLVEAAARGEDFVIARAGKPVVRVTAISPEPPKPMTRVGFLRGRIGVPNDFDSRGENEIAAMFEGES